MIIFFILVIIAVGVIIFYYNNLVIKRNLVQQSWSNVEILLRKRCNLIPNLVSTVKGYAKHEQETFKEVTRARNKAIGAETISTQQIAENQLTQSLSGLLAIAERYPELKANVNFLELQTKLIDIEEDIEFQRRRYNGCVMENNVLIESFPSNQIATWFQFKPATYFDLENIAYRELPKINFK